MRDTLGGHHRRPTDRQVNKHRITGRQAGKQAAPTSPTNPIWCEEGTTLNQTAARCSRLVQRRTATAATNDTRYLFWMLQEANKLANE